MNNEAATQRKADIEAKFDVNATKIAELQVEQNRLQGEYRLLEDILKADPAPVEEAQVSVSEPPEPTEPSPPEEQ